MITESESGFSPVVTSGDAAPGFDDVRFGNLGLFTGALDNSGNVAFYSRLQGTGVDFSSDDTGGKMVEAWS